MNFVYTMYHPVSSSAVDAVYYNENNNDLVVVLHGAAYLYKNVPAERVKSLVDGEWSSRTWPQPRSVGRSFRDLKTKYGPSERLTGVKFVPTDIAAPDMGPVTASKGTPKGLSYAPNVTINVPETSVSVGNTRVQLGVETNDVPEGIKYPHTVVFSVQGMSGTRTYNLEAGSVIEATEALTEVANMLGIEVKVKEVTVHFE